MRSPRNKPWLFAAAIVAEGLGAAALAQEETKEPAEEEEAIDEIVVVAGQRPGDPIDVEARYEALLRDRLIKDLERRDLEEDAWRNSVSTYVEGPARIKWGYDPKDELRTRRSTALTDVQWETTKPATIFSVEF